MELELEINYNTIYKVSVLKTTPAYTVLSSDYSHYNFSMRFVKICRRFAYTMVISVQFLIVSFSLVTTKMNIHWWRL